MEKKIGYSTIDEYIASFPAETQTLLQAIRQVIKDAAPTATEKISYQMPTFYLNGNLVHFAAWKTHIGFYPTSSGTAIFKEDLADYEYSKGTIKFPIAKPLPLELISRIVRFRVEENTGKPKKKPPAH